MLRTIPISIREANRYVAMWHRHNKPVRVARFATACSDESGNIHGVAIVGTPNARALTDGFTAEVLRVATDGTRNACSILYAACLRACRAIGYNRVYTYTLHSESDSSLLASGFAIDSTTAGGTLWQTRGRKYQAICLEHKKRWVKVFRK